MKPLIKVRLDAAGSPDAMRLEPVQVQAPGPGQVWLEQTAIGVNPLDVSQRKGAVAIPFPSGLGLEGAGRVAAVGEGVANVAVGDRVGYATGPLGAYAGARLYPAERLVKLPDALSDEDAAAVLFKGITAQYLLKTTHAVGPGSRIVIYGAAGALGQLMCAWARHLGAFVIGVVSKAASVERARAAGCDEVLVFDAATLPAQVLEATQGRKADVVYDPIGRTTLQASMDCLRPRGLLVSFGAASGLPIPSRWPRSMPRARCSSRVPRWPRTRPRRLSTRSAPRMCWPPWRPASSCPGSGAVMRWPRWRRRMAIWSRADHKVRSS
jgi:NADPH2:quinone reductase